jgi:hypothetical protein
VNGYVEAGYSVVLATLALYGGRLVLRRRALERWLPEHGDRRGQPTGDRSGQPTAVSETPGPSPAPPAQATESPVREEGG